MSSPSVLLLPGNGHHPVRLEGARATLRSRGAPFELAELAYPRADSFDALLESLAVSTEAWGAGRPLAPVYATGIGGLVALSLRARGALLGRPLVLQGAVLWGLEGRLFPRVMRVGPMPRLLAAAFTLGAVRRHFARRHFLVPHDPDWTERFFAGYADAQAFADWFDWLTPRLLRELERELPRTPGALDDIEFWWGERDTVVGVEELRVSERALGTSFPLRTFPAWGHYPMCDDPEGWITEVSRVVDTAGALL